MLGDYARLTFNSRGRSPSTGTDDQDAAEKDLEGDLAETESAAVRRDGKTLERKSSTKS